jgi:hypothetical protein
MWWSPRALGLHVTLAVVVPACVILCDWQVHRALAGNTLSWAYVFEWPFFAAYGTYMWWRLVHEPARAATAGAPVAPAPDSAPPATPVVDDEDEELAAYNRYLAALNEADRQKRR